MAFDRRMIDHWQYAPEGKSYIIREARTIKELDQVHRVTHDSIVHAGYMSPSIGGRLITYPDLDMSPHTCILIALEGDRVIGTNSITADGPLKLHTDRYFPRETEQVRAESGRLISSFRIATEPQWQSGSSFSLILDIIRWSLFLAIQRFEFETMMCTFNPKHEGLYSRLLGAETLARQARIEHGKVSAGAVLMRIARKRLPSRFQAELDELSARYLQAGRREAARSMTEDAFVAA